MVELFYDYAAGHSFRVTQAHADELAAVKAAFVAGSIDARAFIVKSNQLARAYARQCALQPTGD